MSNSNKMRPPYYILINDKDPNHVRYYHEYYYGNVQYENEFGDRDPKTGVYVKNHSLVHFGPRRMHYIETALKFRARIAKIKEMQESDLKIVQVEKYLNSTVKKIKEGLLKPVSFEGVYK